MTLLIRTELLNVQPIWIDLLRNSDRIYKNSISDAVETRMLSAYWQYYVEIDCLRLGLPVW